MKQKISEYKSEKKKKFNKKLLLVPLALVVLGVMVYAISAYFATVHVKANVGEDMQVWDGSNWQTLNHNLEIPVQAVSTFVNQPVTLATVSIKNLATVNENAYFSLPNMADWTVTASDGTNVYALDGTTTLVSPGQHDIVLTAVYTGNTGTAFDGILTIGGTLQATAGLPSVISTLTDNTVIKLVQKDITTWQPLVNGLTATVTYSKTGNTFTATGYDPSVYTLVYYPDTSAGFTGEAFKVVGTSANLPMSNDLNAGAKLWLIPNADLTTTANADGSYTLNWDDASNYLFDLNLIKFTSTAVQPSVNLGTAGDFVILSESGITNNPTSAITGDVGTSPIAGSAITGLTSPEVTGTIYTVDATGPQGSVADATKLTTAIGDMTSAYNNADLLPVTSGDVNVGSGNIGSKVLTPGVYKWTSGVTIPSDVTLSGSANDVYVFQISGTLDISANTHVVLNGVQAKNVYWIVSGATTLETGSDFSGNILDATNIAMQSGATLNGKALAKTAVTLDQNVVTKA